MGARVFLVHGWSVTETTTYQALHLKLAEAGHQLTDIYLGRYVSLEDKVEIRDVAKAMHLALEDELAGDWTTPFHIITHSTGALVTKHWISQHYLSPCCDDQPLKNVVFLAGPHFGSRLAHHGRSMLAHTIHFGATGEQILKSLELGSSFSWQAADEWLDEATWKGKGIRPFNLIGDKVTKSFKDKFAAKVFPAGFEEGSDMVVRCAAGNLNFARYLLHADTGELEFIGGIDKVPFGALSEFIHSGDKYGIMNSIRKKTLLTKQNLKLILDCLSVANENQYAARRQELADATAATREVRHGFAQLDFRFHDHTGAPINDYVFKLGWINDQGREQLSDAVCHTHKNLTCPNHFTVFVEMKKLDPTLTYFMTFDSDSGSDLFGYTPDPFTIRTKPGSGTITNLVREDRTTQIDVVLSRMPNRNLFVFHRGDDRDLHVKWDRKGKVKKKELPIKN